MITMTEAVKHGRHQTEWITITVDEYESMQRTIEILSDRDLMNQIEEGKREGVKIRDFEEFAKELGI
ncbi:MAG TPA: hypothetical protein VMW40_00820 [Candidatus Bathyarchaeia archaeon]|nr:hypothetical protein [Candidatus Bathyarchaeia archaeon]